MNRRIWQWIVSAGGLAVVLAGVLSVDPALRARFLDLARGEGHPKALWARATDVVEAVGSAVQYQSMDNAPLLVFAVAGVLLFAFMFRT
jgi:hypothetical protein